MFFVSQKAFDQLVETQKEILTSIAALDRPESSSDEKSAMLLRYLLGSIDLSDVKPPKRQMTPDERKDYVARMSSAYQTIKPILKNFIELQKDYMAMGGQLYHGDEAKQIIFGRGTVNGLYLVLDELEKLHKESLNNSRPEPQVDNTTPFPSVT